MAGERRSSRGFALCMLVLAVIAALGVALIIYGSATNGLPVPRLPGKGNFAMLGGAYRG